MMAAIKRRMKEGLRIIQNQDWTSRKYRTAWKLTSMFTAMLLFQPFMELAKQIFGWQLAIPALLSEGTYVTFICIVWPAYFGANLAEKSKLFGSGEEKKPADPATKPPEPAGKETI
jgi:hypothetical protein